MEEIIKGRRNIYTVPVTEAKVAFNLTGYEANLVISQGTGFVPVIIKEGVITPETGIIVFTFLPADFLKVKAGIYRIEVNTWKTQDPTIVFTPVEDTVHIKNGLIENPTI